MRRTPVLALAAAASLVLAACGGDDAGPAGAESGDLPRAVQEALESGDLEALQDLDIDLEDFDPENFDHENFDEDAADDLMRSADEMISSFGGDGGGTVTVDGVTYTVEADVCISFGDDLTVDGPAQGSDGSVAWVSVNYSVTQRSDMEEFVDESLLDTIFPAGVDTISEFSVEVDVGQTSRMDSNDDQPSWNAIDSSMFSVGELDYELGSGSARGSGLAEDGNGVAAAFGETAPIEFDVGCT
ncbi:hypothetical protein BH23ACT3_BH23ACT3_04720 [soil metagenome]